MTENLLAQETSPYLLQHKDNPVHWRAWRPDALAEARRDNKPILLSIGYAACHWCHVMAHESFEDPETAAVMNRLFVNIKVDREERPDIDQIYMTALHALGEQGGWPLTMFLTPEAKPIWGGTYFPKTARYGRPGFISVMEEVNRVFREEPGSIAHNANLMMDHLSAAPPSGDGATLTADLLDRAAARLIELIDREHGGLKGAPKFPQTSLFEFLWRAADRTGEPAYRDAVLVTLRNICQGGIYDHLAGGFARYSVDDRWLVPHFEKMLYDNAQLVELLTQAFLTTNEPLFAQRVDETVAWLRREMTTPDGAFAASIDADSEGEEGKFAVWSLDEIVDVLGERAGASFAETYGVRPSGNWEGANILNRLGAMDRLDAETEAELAADREKLFARRRSRVPPATDDKILADWNGLMIAALAFAGATFARPDWTEAAERAFAFITGPMARDGRLAHAWRADQSIFPGLATDYADTIKAALALHAATLNPAYIATAERLAGTLRDHHWDDSSPGYFLSADDADALIVRPRSTTDEATPSANSIMTQNLVRLWHLTGNESYRDDADAILAAATASIAQNLFAATAMMSALDLRLRAIDVVIVAPQAEPTDPAVDALIRPVRDRWTPNTILAFHAGVADLPAAHPAAGKAPVDGLPTAYVCRGETCSLPVTDPAALAALLEG